MKFVSKIFLLVATLTATYANATSLISNSGFETGSFNPWVIVDSGFGSPVVTSAEAHTGTYSAAGFVGQFFRQDFAPVDTSLITEASFWAKRDGGVFTGGRLFYSDGTDYSFIRDLTSSGNDWQFVDFTSELIAGKNLIGVRFGGSSPGPAYFDDFTINANVAAVPLPAALPLFASGLGAMVLFARARKRKNSIMSVVGGSMRKYILIVLGALFLFAMPPSAFAVTVQLDFTASGFPIGAPTDPVHGVITYQAASLTGLITSLTSIDLTIASHTYTLGEIGFQIFTPTSFVVGGVLNDVLGANFGTDDFFILWNPASNPLNITLQYTAPGFDSLFSPNQKVGSLSELSSVPLPSALPLLATGLGLLGLLGMRKRRNRSDVVAA